MSESSRQADALAADKRRLLAQLLKEKGINTTRAPMIPKRQQSGPAVLSFAQQRLWFLDQLEPGSVAYNLSKTIPLPGKPDVMALEQALNEIVKRHESLRTRFRVMDGEPVQEVMEEAEIRLVEIEIKGESEEERMREAKREMLGVAQRPFNLSDGPLFRAALVKMSEEQYLLLLTMHHIISDGWSINLLVQELTTLYHCFMNNLPSPLSELPIQYADYAVWQRQHLQGPLFEEQVTYWKEQLKGAPALLALPTDRPRPAVFSHHGARHNFALSQELSSRLSALSRRHGVTLFMTLLGAFQLLLSRYSGERDVVVGTPIAGRLRRETEPLIGFFINTLVMRLKIDEESSFLKFLEQVKEAALGAYAHQEVPFEKLVEELEPERSMSYTPLFQVMFVLQNNGPKVSVELSDEYLKSIDQGEAATQFDIGLSIMETGQKLVGTLSYNRDLYDSSTINRLAGHYKRLLEAICENPDQRLYELPLLTDAEREQVLVQWNAKQDYPQPEYCIHELFEQQAARSPHSIALIYQDQQLSYSELNRRANRLAHKLVKLGVVPDSLVGILCDRSIEMVVGLLAVLKAGGAYLPLDPTYPAERLMFMLKDAELKVLLVEEETDRLVAAEGLEVVGIREGSEGGSAEDEENVRGGSGLENIAYVIYTSGSTGQPKGVAISHANVVRLFSSTESLFNFTDRDVWTLFHSYAFDFSVWEIWGALLYGGKLVIVPYLVSRSPEAFYELLLREGVTVLNQTPSAFHQLVDVQASDERTLSLRKIIFGGETLALQSLAPWYARYADDSPQLINIYGITETTVFVTYKPLSASDSDDGIGSVIGIPLGDLEAYILDEHLQPVPVGVTGELHVGGEGLARGYFNRPGLTAERFIPHPFSTTPGARLYRSGDLARYLEDGKIEFLGRRDGQVKLRGHRIELGEIEAVLREHEQVRDAVVMLREDTPGDHRLAAYILTEEAANVETQSVRQYLQRRLPEYMIPRAFVRMAAWPLSSSGKVDKRALPAPGQGRLSESSYVAPSNCVEEIITSIWKEVLKVEEVGVEDNFFELGGHSLLATQVITRVRESFQTEELPLRKLFEEPTVAALARAVSEEVGSVEVAEEIARTIKELEQYSAEEVAALLSQQDAEKTV